MLNSILPVTRSSLADDLAHRIQALIRQRGFQPGDRLPAITEMAREFGVGAPTLREALKTLEAVGVVSIRHGSGVYVHRPQESLIISNPVFQAPATKKLLLDLIAARMPIEVLSAEEAARSATSAHLRELERLLARADDNLGDDEILNETNMAFHRQIAVASGNAVVKQLLEVLTSLFTHEQRLILDIQDERRQDHAQHRGILAALEQRNASLAGRRMRAHLSHVQDVLAKWDPVRKPLAHT